MRRGGGGGTEKCRQYDAEVVCSFYRRLSVRLGNKTVTRVEEFGFGFEEDLVSSLERKVGEGAMEGDKGRGLTFLPPPAAVAAHVGEGDAAAQPPQVCGRRA